MIKPLLFPLALGIAGLFYRAWLFRQDYQGRVVGSLGLLSIAFGLYAYALYGACHGEVNFFVHAFACTRTAPIPYNSDYYKVGRPPLPARRP